MATISGIRGMLLEEAILYLLRVSGYRTVEQADPHDTTLTGNCYSGLKVSGRGGVHQIDAIADMAIATPFTYAQRLLVEAKCYADTTPVRIEIVRNAVGVLKDVGEYWVTRDGLPAKARFHYLYALFSASEYTKEAEKYAYAHDIYLIPLAHSQFIQPIIKAIRNINSQTFDHATNDRIDISMTALRSGVRANIRDTNDHQLSEILADSRDALAALRDFCGTCRRVNAALIAMIAGRFPIFLVPNPSLNLNQIQNDHIVSIHWNREKREKGWYLRSRSTGELLFSFDLPLDVFKYYAEQNVLSPAHALNLKEDVLSEIQAIVTSDNFIRIIRFRLDREWLSNVRSRIDNIQSASAKIR